MHINTLFNLFLLSNFLISVKALDIQENSDELEIAKHLFAKINRIIDGNDSLQDELSKISNRIQNLEAKFSQNSYEGVNNSTCNSLQLTSSFEQPPDNYCFGNNWTIIQRRMDGSENFYRDWNDYKHGFGNKSHEFFAGLETIHQMTTKTPHELIIVLEDYGNSKRYAKYDAFVIGSEAEGYALQLLGKYSGNAGDSLTYHKGPSSPPGVVIMICMRLLIVPKNLKALGGLRLALKAI